MFGFNFSFSGLQAKAITAAKGLLNKALSFIKIPKFKLQLKLPTFSLPKLPKYKPPKIQIKKNHDSLLKQTATALIDVEKKMSPGGTQIITYTNDLQVNVGAQYIDSGTAPPVSVVSGLPVPSKIMIGTNQTSISQKSTPHVQSVAHSIPWGTYGIMASNKFNAVVGAGGIMMHTDGCIDINSGGRTTISSLYEMNLTTSGGNFNITCGHNLLLRGDTVTIRTANKNDQVVVDSNLGISRNLTVHGSTYIDGELYCQHITAPSVARETSEDSGTRVYVPAGSLTGYILMPPGGGISMILDMLLGGNIPVYCLENINCIAEPHTHSFYTIASDLHPGNPNIRDLAAAAINGGKTGEAKSQDHGGSGMV